MAKSDEALTFSAREMQVLALAWQCFESEPKIDIKKLARLTGYTEGSASVTMGKIKRKLKTHGAGGGSGSESNPATATASTPKKTPAPKTPRTCKRGAGASADETPSKKVKGERVEDEGEEFKIKPEPVLDGYGAYNDYAGGL